MRFKKLELQGFKSFAHKTTLEFPTPVSAIVGPNGSGKSNIADAIRWVLGEQSMKTLRTKKGEDLIFNGTHGLSKMGKASVFLHFDNSEKKLNLDFEEIAVGRQIFRNGESQYFLNDAPARLKDILAAMASAGMGEMKYNIVNQGSADSLLSASPKERREIFEEALGLKELQLKKTDAEKKLDNAKTNLEQVKNLIAEISPHLRYLEKQAKKFSERESVQNSLKEKQIFYFSALFTDFAARREKIGVSKNPLLEKISEIEKELEKLGEEAKKEEDSLPNFGGDFSAIENSLKSLEEKRQALEREIGRLEGRIEAEREMAVSKKTEVPGSAPVSVAYAASKIKEIKESFGDFDFSSPEKIKDRIAEILKRMDGLLEELETGVVKNEREKISAAAPETEADARRGVSVFEEEKNKLKAELEGILKHSEEFREKLRILTETNRQAQEKLRDLERLFRSKENVLQGMKSDLMKTEIEEERLSVEQSEGEREMAEAGFLAENFLSGGDFAGVNFQDLRRQIERLKIEMERIGGIDEETIKEYNETRDRHEFLSRQTTDLEKSSASLYELIAEIDKKIESDFKAGFEKINEEFNRYFGIIFEGGSGRIDLVREREEIEEEEEDEEPEEKNGNADLAGNFKKIGVEVKVNLPRKKVKSTAMLSGGERALTSIALLFALIAVNPPPFIVLDEIDAALDEANSRRFSKILRDLALKTQFIVITHNRETMNQAGVLYGVTSHEDGSSKLLSVKLEEAEQKYVR